MTESKVEIPERVQEALAQVEVNQYVAEFERHVVKDFCQYGIAFGGKECHIEAG